MIAQDNFPLWEPDKSHLAGSHLTAFTRLAENRWNQKFASYADLWQYSVDFPAAFWSLVWDYCDVIGDKGKDILLNGERMQEARFFPEARLNYAENLLRRNDDSLAMVFWGEDQVQQQWRWQDLVAEVSRLQQALHQHGIQPGDRVAGWMPNLPHTMAAMLATASLGAVWTSCSPDFGSDAALDRFGQTSPRLLFCADGYWYNGKPFDYRDKVAKLAAAMPALEIIIVVPCLNQADDDSSHLPRSIKLETFLAPWTPKALTFKRMPFNHPLFILYSSGTTGKPKCIVHGAGGTLLQHMKEHQLHADIHRQERVLYFTTCGWMMWNWLASALASQATLMLYDGSPFAESGDILWRYADSCQISHVGISAKFIDASRKQGQHPGNRYRLDSLRCILSTGSPLMPDGFDWVYQSVKRNLCLSSISGGTDIVSCFALGAVNLPVYRGELQCRGLGMAVDVYDQDGHPVRQTKGELVCTRPFPSMPVCFWNDTDGSAMQRAYFSRFDNIWSHGDFAEITAHNGMIIHGRSDAVLNPGGVRIGTAEIYRLVESFDEVIESLAVGQQWQDDERVILFVRLADGVPLDAALSTRIKARIRDGASPRHVPAHIIAIADLPRTSNGKIAELAVKKVLHNQTVQNLAALANPESLHLFENLPELAQ